VTDYLADAKELLAIADDPDTRTNADEWICQRDAGVRALVGILEELRRLNEGATSSTERYWKYSRRPRSRRPA
jgi:hypothetical protein